MIARFATTLRCGVGVRGWGWHAGSIMIEGGATSRIRLFTSRPRCISFRRLPLRFLFLHFASSPFYFISFPFLSFRFPAVTRLVHGLPPFHSSTALLHSLPLSLAYLHLVSLRFLRILVPTEYYSFSSSLFSPPSLPSCLLVFSLVFSPPFMPCVVRRTGRALT